MRGKTLHSIILAMLLAFFINLLPVYAPPAIAADNTVTIRNTYTNFNRSSKMITIEDNSIAAYTEVGLSLESYSLGWQNVANPQIIGGTIVQSTLDKTWSLRTGRVTGKTGGLNRYINYSDMNENGIPEVISVETPLVGVNDLIVLNGPTNLGVVTGPEFSIVVGSVAAQVSAVSPGGDQISLAPKVAGSQFPVGVQDIVITRTTTQDSFDETATHTPYSLEIMSVYKSAVRVVGQLNLSGMTMFPTMGETGSTVTFQRSTLNLYDVYFIEDLNDPSQYTAANKVRDVDYQWTSNPPDPDVVTIKVPSALSAGPYWVVFTNANSLSQGINARYVYPGQQYTVIQLSQQPSISNVDPRKSPSQTQTLVTVSGYYFSKANIPGLTLATPPTMSFDPSTGILDYGNGTLTIGATGYPVHVTRKFEVIIGNILPFAGTGFSFDPANPDAAESFTVNTIPFALDHEEIHDVSVRMTTTITPALPLPAPQFNGSILKEVVKPNYYTYAAATETPLLTLVNPSVIPVDGTPGNMYLNTSMGELQIALHGDKYLVTRYMDSGSEVIHYPVITIGNKVIDPNPNPLPGEFVPTHFVVLKDTTPVTGLPGNELGDTILITLPAGPPASGGFPVVSPDSRNVEIRNPIRGSANYSVPYNFDNIIQFVSVSLNDFPVISTVTPNIVDVSGGEQVVIAGSNFRTGATVVIDGQPVPSITISGDNTQISFNAPAGREGTTQLQVINPNNGGIATASFTYTQGYTQPDLNSIDPGKGTTNTSVIASGANFLKPDPTVSVTDPTNISEQGIVYRLVGTRILMDGHDINSYNYSGGQIQLQPYVNGMGGLVLGEPVFVQEAGGLVRFGAGFNSVVFWDAAHTKFYRLTRDVRENPVLDDGLGTTYTISCSGGTYYATSGGTQYTIDQSTSGRLIFNGLTLDAYTPYVIENISGVDQITGNRAQVLNSTTIQFSVPLLISAPWTGDGLYDVSVENPDTRKATLSNSFEYFSSGRVIPVVSDIVSDQGPDTGGNLVVLTSPVTADPNTGFVNQGANKTRLWIATQEVPASDITISPNGKTLTFRMPAYNGSIRQLGTDRLTVPVNLVNPDGASFSVNYDNPITVTRVGGTKIIRGYTYVIPSSHPTIDRLTPNKGAASGGLVVDIFGSDFRDYEPFTDLNGNGRWDVGEPYTDLDGNGMYTAAAPKDAAHQRASAYDPQYQILTSVLLPQVYFGLLQAEIIDYNSGWLQVVIPPGTSIEDVYVVNNDSGISNKSSFEYISSNPTISSISPNVGDKKGGTEVEIAGTQFQQGPVNVMLDQIGPGGLNLIDNRTMTLVRAGNVSNASLADDDPNSGRIQSGIGSVTLSGALSARYDANTQKLTVTILNEGTPYTYQYGWDGLQSVYTNTTDLTTSAGLRFPYEQLVNFKIINNRLLVTSGYASSVTYNSATDLIVTMPYFYTVGATPVTVINPDGGSATSSFTYTNPASHPAITNVTKDGKDPVTVQEEINGTLTTVREIRVTYKGGNVVAVLGSDFRENATIQIGTIKTIPAADITYTLPGKMSFTMPAVPESEVDKLQRVLVINEDGGSASSDKLSPPIYIKFIKGETAPKITSITPDKGPTKGGTLVTIAGADFRDGLNVTFGGVQATGVTVVDYKTITCYTPANVPGTVDVKVENPDGELSDPMGTFTYISGPTVTKVVKADDPTESTLVKTIDINGGQTIKIKGSGFMDGAKVVFAPKVTAVTDPSITTGLIYIDGAPYTLDSGTDGTDVQFIDSETLTVKTPSGKLDTKGLIVINPDTGASNVYGDITYTLPQIESPLNVKAELVHDSYYNTDRYIKVHWDAVTKATGYEIYVVINDQKEFIGTTTETAYLYKELEPNTRYRFVVTAVWDYSSSPPSAESNTVKTGNTVGNPDLDMGLNDLTVSTLNGDTANITIGKTDYNKSGNNRFDLTSGSLAGAKKVVVVIPAYVIGRTDAPDIEINAKGFNLVFNPSAFYFDSIKQNLQRDDAGVRLNIGPYSGSFSTDATRMLNTPLSLDAQVFAGQDNTKADTLIKSITLGMDYDSSLLSARRLKNPSLYRYNPATKGWDTAGAWKNIDPFKQIRINQMGVYVVMGTRG